MKNIDQETKESFMRVAIAMAKKAAKAGDVPIGAVIVREGQIIAEGYNRTEAEQDPTLHAEMIAIREAARVLGAWRLLGCEMYVTTEPCVMCAGACVLSRLDAVYVGCESPKSGAAGSVKDILTAGDLNHTLVYEQGILRDDCADLLKSFFSHLRTRKQKEESQMGVTK
ncbi:MAG: tRNA adenosine(34) deaminase TadA [Clostridiales Family XIII bacterium]|nr:tRNA adenosine(34) deaminase TadA [Clostridiales Family XIII bacterium]